MARIVFFAEHKVRHALAVSWLALKLLYRLLQLLEQFAAQPW